MTSHSTPPPGDAHEQCLRPSCHLWPKPHPLTPSCPPPVCEVCGDAPCQTPAAHACEAALPSDDETEYALVMPFVVCQSEGGPYEDQAFTAGWELGVLAERLSTLAAKPGVVHIATVRTPSLPQVDLLAMKEGWTLETFQEEADWTTVRLRHATSR